MKEEIRKIKQFIKEHLDELRWLHTQEVVKTALILAINEKADKEIVEISAWLHDVGATDKREKIVTHHIYSAEIAQNLLRELNFEPKKIEQIVKCIKEHMGPIPGIFGDMLKAEKKDWDFLPRPSTRESRVLYDADMINLCSPFGVAKIIIHTTERGGNFNKAIVNAKNLSLQAFNDLKTRSGRELGKKYFSASEEFLKMIKL